MIDWNKPVQTRDGRKVRVLCTDGPKSAPVVGLVDDEYVDRWTLDGSLSVGRWQQHDLINAPEPEQEIVAWAVVTRTGNTVGIFGSRDLAVNAAFYRGDRVIRLTGKCRPGDEP